MSNNIDNNLAFLKVRNGLWSSLQRHLNLIYEAEEAFNRSLNFTDVYPFDVSLIDADKLEQYWLVRNNFRNLFIDEVVQLETLVKAVKSKKYEEADKKELYLLILGYVDIIKSVSEALDIYNPTLLPKDEELTAAKSQLCRITKFIRLQIRGVLPRFGI